MTERAREIIETRAEIDARFWRDLYPADWPEPPNENAVGKAFARSWEIGHLGDERCSQEAYDLYHAAFMRYLGFPTGNA